MKKVPSKKNPLLSGMSIGIALVLFGFATHCRPCLAQNSYDPVGSVVLNDIYEGLPFTDQSEFLAIGKSNPGSYFRLSHYIGDGVGVSDSLTVFETFQPLWNGATSLWFFDGRFVMRNNVINESRFAGSAGIGFRQLFDSEVGWGASGWVDIDELNRNQYHQVGVSLERFGRFWDLRANGYFPVGTERNNIGFSAVGQNLAFSGNLLAFPRTRLDEVAMKGVDI